MVDSNKPRPPSQGSGEVITIASVKDRMALFKMNSTRNMSGPKSRMRKPPVNQNVKTINVASRRAMLDDYAKQHQTSNTSTSNLRMESVRHLKKANSSSNTTTPAPAAAPSQPAVEKDESPSTTATLGTSSTHSSNSTGATPPPQPIFTTSNSKQDLMNTAFNKPDFFFEGESSDEELNDAGERKTQQAKDEEEVEAREGLNSLLQKELGDSKRVISWGGARVRYIKAVDKLRPEEYDVPVQLDEDKPAAKQNLKQQRQVAADTKGRFNELSSAWVKYDDVAQDKPFAAGDEDWEMQHDLDEIEDEVLDEWDDFCERVVDTKSIFFDNDDDDDDSEDSDMEKWRQEAKKIKADADEMLKRRDKRERKRDKVQTRKRMTRAAKASAEKQAATKEVASPTQQQQPPPQTLEPSQDSNPQPSEESSKPKARAKSGAGTRVSRRKSKTKEEDKVPEKEPAPASYEEDEPVPERPDIAPEPQRPDFHHSMEISEADDIESLASMDDHTRPHIPLDKSPSSRRKGKKKGKPKASSGNNELPKSPNLSPSNKKASVKRKGEDPWKKTASVSGFKAWSHQPKEFKEVGTKVTVMVPKKTDCWRKTRHDFIMDNAPFYWHKVTGDFEVMVHVTGDFKTIYDKAGIMIRHDEKHWMASSLEYFNDGMNHSTSVTHDFTDWSLCPLPKETKTDGAWICCKRIGNAYETFYSLNGLQWTQTRQGLLVSEEESVRVGVFAACPMGISGFQVEFDLYTCKTIANGGAGLGAFHFHS